MRHGDKLDEQTQRILAKSRIFTARRELVKSAGLLLPPDVLIRSTPQKRLTVPSEALVREENRDYVFLQTDERNYSLREVTLGIEHDGKRVVQGGLRGGERIVIDGAFHLNNERKRRAQGG